jgi:hypothetical protein
MSTPGNKENLSQDEDEMTNISRNSSNLHIFYLNMQFYLELINETYVKYRIVVSSDNHIVLCESMCSIRRNFICKIY